MSTPTKTPSLPDANTHDPEPLTGTGTGETGASLSTSLSSKPTQEPKTTKVGNFDLGGIVLPLGVFAGVIAAWYFVSYVLLDDARRFLMPPPHVVIVDGLLGSAAPDMWAALGRTTGIALTGLFIASVIGIGWAILMSMSKNAETALFPYAVFLQCIPILALVPLVGFWFGFGFSARVFVCVLIALFPLVSNTLFGLKSVEPGMRDLFALQKPSRFTVLRKLELPAAMPSIFVGLRTSAGLAVVGAIVGDFFFRQGTPGIGMLLDNYRSRLQSPELFAAIVLASLLGVVVFLFFGWLGNRVVGKWYGK